MPLWNSWKSTPSPSFIFPCPDAWSGSVTWPLTDALPVTDMPPLVVANFAEPSKYNSTLSFATAKIPVSLLTGLI